MKIGQSPEIPTAVSQATNAAQKAPSAPVPASASATANQSTRSAGVAVTVSNQARSLELSGRASAADIDTKKVETVKAAIQDGTYTVNAEAIADKLLADSQEQIQRVRN